MARIETANLEGLLPLQHCNISDPVGFDEINERNDVMLIQALFKLIGYGDNNARKFFRLTAKDLPEPTGNFDGKTVRAIWAFQQTMSRRLLNIDGKIHPASYANRVIKGAFNGSRLMAITLLNMEAEDAVVMLAANTLSGAVKKIAPNIMFA